MKWFKNILRSETAFLYIDNMIIEKRMNEEVCLYGNEIKKAYFYAGLEMQLAWNNLLISIMETITGDKEK